MARSVALLHRVAAGGAFAAAQRAHREGRYAEALAALAPAPPGAAAALLRLRLQIRAGRPGDAALDLRAIDPLCFDEEDVSAACLFAAYGSYALNLAGEQQRAVLFDTTMRVYDAFAADAIARAEAHLVHSYIVPEAAESALAKAYRLENPRLTALAHRFDANRSLAAGNADEAAVHAAAGLQALEQEPEPERGLQSDLVSALCEAAATVPSRRRSAAAESAYSAIAWTDDLACAQAGCAVALARAAAARGDLFFARRLCREAAALACGAPLRLHALCFAAQLASAERDQIAFNALASEIRRTIDRRIDWSSTAGGVRLVLLEAAATLAPIDREAADRLVELYDEQLAPATFERPKRSERLGAATEALLRGRLAPDRVVAASYLTEALTLASESMHLLLAAEAAAYLRRDGVATPAVLTALRAAITPGDGERASQESWLIRLAQ